MIMYSADAGRPDFKYGKFQIPEVKVQNLHNYSELEEQGISFRSENLIPRHTIE